MAAITIVYADLRYWLGLKVNHEGHPSTSLRASFVTQRKIMLRTAFVKLRALRGSRFFPFLGETEPLPDLVSTVLYLMGVAVENEEFAAADCFGQQPGRTV